MSVGSTGSGEVAWSSEALMHRELGSPLMAGDTVVFASSLIPGNENAVYRVINGLSRLGATVVHKGNSLVHVSGHASAGELLYCYNIVKPRNVMPVHGTWRMLRANAALAASTAHRLPRGTDDQTAYVMASRKNTSRWMSLAVGILTVALLGTIGLSLFAYVQWRQAEEQRVQAAREQSIRKGWTITPGDLAGPGRASDPETQALPPLGPLPPPEGAERLSAASAAANQQLEAPESAVAERRGRIEVQYFPKVVGGQADLEGFELTLNGLGFVPVRRVPSGSSPTNAVWFGSEVEKDDVQQVAYALIRAGIDLRYIGCFAEEGRRARVIRSGGSRP